MLCLSESSTNQLQYQDVPLCCPDPSNSAELDWYKCVCVWRRYGAPPLSLPITPPPQLSLPGLHWWQSYVPGTWLQGTATRSSQRWGVHCRSSQSWGLHARSYESWGVHAVSYGGTSSSSSGWQGSMCNIWGQSDHLLVSSIPVLPPVWHRARASYLDA